jgi:hypothetical protein
MLKLRILLFFALLVSGCASASVLIAGSGGLEREYAYPYKKVFYSADVAANGIGEFVQFYTKETNFDKGFISLNGGAPAVRVVVNVEKIDDNKTVVRIKKYSKSAAEYLGANFFQNLERLLSNK